jgi:hypothetical protein
VLGSPFFWLSKIAVLKVLLASIYTNFTTIIVDDEGMEQRDDIIAGPVADKLILSFKRSAIESTEG